MLDERCNQPIRLGTSGTHVFERVVTRAGGAGVGCLVGIQTGIDEKAVFEIVNPNLRRFLVSYRTQVASNFEATLVRFLDCSTQFRAGDMSVRLERRHPAVRPIGYRL